ncbi:MAG: MaoC family dehydratase [Promethearchaeia archaeon]
MIKLEFNPENSRIGQELPNIKKIIDYKTYRRYNRLIGEINPIHLNKKYAQRLGFENIVVAGNYLFVHISDWFSNLAGKTGKIRKITLKFGNPVYIDEELTYEGKIADITKKDDSMVIVCDYIVKKNNDIITCKGKCFLEFNLKVRN